jgi:hypothetical protein
MGSALWMMSWLTGFAFGAITDLEAERCEEGDAFVIASDGSRAGLEGIR